MKDFMRKKYNTHDPDDMYRWARTSRWVKPLRRSLLAVGVGVAGVAVVVFVWMLTVIAFL